MYVSHFISKTYELTTESDGHPQVPTAAGTPRGLPREPPGRLESQRFRFIYVYMSIVYTILYLWVGICVYFIIWYYVCIFYSDLLADRIDIGSIPSTHMEMLLFFRSWLLVSMYHQHIPNARTPVYNILIYLRYPESQVTLMFDGKQHISWVKSFKRC